MNLKQLIEDPKLTKADCAFNYLHRFVDIRSVQPGQAVQLFPLYLFACIPVFYRNCHCICSQCDLKVLRGESICFSQ